MPDDVAGAADFAAYEAHFAALSERFGYPIRIPMRSIVRLGNQLLRARAFDKGISVFERAREIYLDLPEAHWRVGEAYRLAGRPAEARPHFERAYELAIEQSAPDLADYRQTLEDLDRQAARARGRARLAPVAWEGGVRVLAPGILLWSRQGYRIGRRSMRGGPRRLGVKAHSAMAFLV